MTEVIVLLAATGIAGSVVWRLTAGPAATLRPRLRPRRVRFEETLEVTALPLADGVSLGQSGFAFEETVVEPPRRAWSALRLVGLILTVAGAGAGAIWLVAHFVNQALESRLTGP